MFDFESICVQEESFKTPIQQNGLVIIFPFKFPFPQILWQNQFSFATLILIISLLPWKFSSPKQCKNEKFFFDIKTTININLGSILEKLTQRHNRSERADLDDCDNETCTSTQFVQIQKKQLIDMQGHLKRYCNVLPIFGFNSANYDLKLIKSFLLPVLVNERNFWTDYYHKNEPVFFVQFRWYSVVGCFRFSRRRRNNSWFFLKP